MLIIGCGSKVWMERKAALCSISVPVLCLTLLCILSACSNFVLAGFTSSSAAALQSLLLSVPLNDDTKILTETNTETFFTIPNFPKPKPRLFSDTKFFRNRNRYFSSETKFSETETETFFRDQIFPKPRPRLFFQDQIFRNQNWNPQRFGKSLETET